MSIKKLKKGEFLTYKGKPLVRNGNILYYGSMAEPCVLMLTVLSTKKVKEMDVAEKVQVQLLATDPDLRPRERVLKTSEKIGLYNAMDIGAIWLERELTK